MHKYNFLKDMLATGATVIGTWSVIPSPTVADVLSLADLDFIIIDAEHGPVSYETAQNMIRACENNGCCPIYRVGDNDENLILRALEIGSHGVVIPQVTDAEGARRAAMATRYFPHGNRGYSPFTRAGSFTPTQDHTNISNSSVLTAIIV